MDINEASAAAGPMQALLQYGLDGLSKNQEITFTLYSKVVLSEDGYVFWVNVGNPLIAKGSLHYATDRVQEEDQTIGINTMIFSSETEITQFNEITPNGMWIAAWLPPYGGDPLFIAFAKRGRYYDRAKIWHYVGYAVYPAMQSQIINSMSDIPVEPIVSNSLPIWLSQNQSWSVYPSFLVPDNVVPPYIVAHIDPTLTKTIGPFPIKGYPGVVVPNSGAAPMYNWPTSQLMQDTVRLTFYGLNNQQIIQFYNSLIDYSLNTDAFGFCGNDPAIRDEKRTQVEIASIAMKKTLILDASYYQATSDAIARRYILSVGDLALIVS